MSSIKPSEAIACYLLSRRQGVDMIAYMTGMSSADVKRHIKEGERLLDQRSKPTRGQKRSRK